MEHMIDRDRAPALVLHYAPCLPEAKLPPAEASGCVPAEACAREPGRERS